MREINENLEYLTRYLSDMGRCGRYFSMHHRIQNHDYKCRRATLALELARPYLLTDSSGDIFWRYVVEFIEAINGGVFYGLPGLWLEVPQTIAHFDQDEVRHLYENPRAIYECEILPKYKIALRAALRECYRTMRGVDLSSEGLHMHGLKPDPKFDYDDV